MTTTTSRGNRYAMPTKCKATKADGSPCRAWAMKGSDFCFFHDPAKAPQREAAQALGGEARHGRNIGETGEAPEVSLETPADVLELLRIVIRDTFRLENSIARSRALGYLAAQALKGFEVSELEQRMAAIEEALANVT